VDLFHMLYCSGSMCVGVTVWFGWGGVVSLCRLKQCFSLHNDICICNLFKGTVRNPDQIASNYRSINTLEAMVTICTS
jgi:hypothetical protein